MKKEVVLQQIATRLRHHVLHITTRAGSGHPTTCMSCAELIACLFFSEMKFNVEHPSDLANDEFVLSKGHAAPILWATYAEAGIIPFSELPTFRKFESQLEGHPTPRMPWVKVATGSLGQGLSVGVGMALAQRLHKSNAKTFVLMGDGECAEGSVWEAASLAAKENLSNLVAFVDVNRLGQSGESLHGKHADVWKKKFESFGWSAKVINGHNVNEILRALAEKNKGPFVIIAKTVKGKGVSFLEDKEGWHGKALSPLQLIDALQELGPLPSVDAKSFIHSRPTLKISVSWKESPKIHYSAAEQVATREAYGSMLAKLGKDSRIVALDGDVKNSTFAEKFKALYPERFVDSFIAEQNMVGMAMGLAAKGFIPFASSFAAFLSRAHDQLRMAAISRLNLKCVGSHAGVSIGEDGPSQMALEDIAMFRSLPESTVLYPCDAVSAEKCTALLAQSKGIGYLRTTRPKTPILYKPTDSFSIGGSKLLCKGKDVLIIAAGITVHESLKAAQMLKNKGISTAVLDAYSIKPLDAKTIKAQAKGKQVIVVEDHYAQGGLGEAVASLGVPITHLCIKEIPRSGKAEELMAHYGIDAKAIVNAVKK